MMNCPICKNKLKEKKHDNFEWYSCDCLSKPNQPTDPFRETLVQKAQPKNGDR